jgi:hypothetical protein
MAAAFFASVTVLGLAFPASSLEDFLVDRAFSLVMIVLVVPWLLKPQPLSVPAAWSALLHPTSRVLATRPFGSNR